MVQRTDAVNSIVAYTYDKLGRMQSKSYNGALFAWWCYDGNVAGSPVDCSKSVGSGANLIGRLTGAFTTASATTYTGYDTMGRVNGSTQSSNLNTNSYQFFYTYDLLGNLETETYPSSRQVTTCYDVAGRPNKVQKGTATSPLGYYTDSVLYGPHGTPWQIHWSVPGLYEHWHFNTPQLQPSDIGLGTTNSGTYYVPSTTSTDWASWKAHYDFNSAGDAVNNGNVRAQTATAQGNSFTQSYQCDSYNRLSLATETGGTSGWTQPFTYDRWGNRSATLTPFGGIAYSFNNQH